MKTEDLAWTRQDEEFYQLQEWLYSHQSQYRGEIVAYTNLNGNWEIIAHSADQTDLMKQIDDLLEQGRITPENILYFRRLE